jgi:hypothetical protein
LKFEDVYDYEGVIAYDAKHPKALAGRVRGDSMEPRPIEVDEEQLAWMYPVALTQMEEL